MPRCVTRESFLERLRLHLRPLEEWGTFRRGARAAAVTAVLYERDGLWQLPFVKRRADLRSHPGQVALPGGSLHPRETPWQAAAREVEEETGIRADLLQPLGAGPPIYAAVSNFSVACFVAHLEEPPAKLRPDTNELDSVLEVPLDRLLDTSAWLQADEPWMGTHFPWEGDSVWGLTARILDSLLPLFREALRGPS